MGKRKDIENAIAEYNKLDGEIFDLCMGVGSYDENGRYKENEIPQYIYDARKKAFDRCMELKVKNMSNTMMGDVNYAHDVRFIRDKHGLRVDRRTLPKDLRGGYIECPYDFCSSDAPKEHGEYVGIVSWYWTSETWEYPSDYIEYELMQLQPQTEQEEGR